MYGFIEYIDVIKYMNYIRNLSN